MTLKRLLEGAGGEDSGVPADEVKRRRLLAATRKVRMASVVVQEGVPYLERMIRKCVQDGVAHGFNRYFRPCDQTALCGSRQWQLQFCTILPTKLFTNSNILSVDRSPIKIVLWDSISKTIVQSGRLSSVKVSIVVLDGGFGPDDREEWSKEEFDRKIIRNREGKRPLLTGELVVSLKDGVGYIGDVSITDNSCWIPSGKFRLAVKAHAESDQFRIREGMTNPFRVKDHRGESCQKRHPPSLDDEVWRLERIAKDGPTHKKLSQSKICSVRDFLRRHAVHPASLQDELCIKNKAWETIIGHATSCVLDDKKYLYEPAQGICLFFDTIYRFFGVTFDGHNFCSFSDLETHQKMLVENLKQHAYKNIKDWISVDNSYIFGGSTLLTSSGADNLNSCLGPQDSELRDEGPSERQRNHDASTISALYDHELQSGYISFENLPEEFTSNGCIQSNFEKPFQYE